MSAPGEHAVEENEMEEMDEAGSDEDEGVEMEEEGAEGEEEKKVYVPGIEPLEPGEELEMDRSAYRMYHECQTGKLKSSLLPMKFTLPPCGSLGLSYLVVYIQVLHAWASTS